MSSPSSKARDPPRAVADHRGWEAVDLGQKSALARHPKIMDEDIINEKVKNADVPHNLDAT